MICWNFVGAGNMASSLIGGLINDNIDASTISVIDPSRDACTSAKQRFGVNVLSSIQEIESSDHANHHVFIIAVKPPIVKTVCDELSLWFGKKIESSDSTHQHSLVISVAAGVKVESMEAWLPSDTAVVRCMPNTPALLGLGATAMYPNSIVNQDHRQYAQILMDKAGTSRWVEQEELLDAVTALSGSGPAYFFYLIEHMIEAGKVLGLDDRLASDFAIETAFGAASMAKQKLHTPSVLRENVTSKGGTTAAALQVFNDHEVPEIIGKAMQAAYDRARDLGDELANRDQ